MNSVTELNRLLDIQSGDQIKIATVIEVLPNNQVRLELSGAFSVVSGSYAIGQQVFIQNGRIIGVPNDVNNEFFV